MKLPELLCPAGSMEALAAAVDGGADAVYFGGNHFNARMYANNFDPAAMREAVSLCHAYGVKAYLTLNTLPLDREMTTFLDAAYDAAQAGVDALIVADLGGAAAIHRTIPSLELHASTQASGHNADAGRMLSELGFSRMVLAREVSLSDIRTYVAQSPIEAEVFVHGALCVCHSGQCLFSSLIGGRSGNRGACAQPCRLPYTVAGNQTGYPLSLKDLCLAQHVPALIEAGVSSLKIEGRMKAPEYVHAVTRVWRQLLDERRPATAEEMTYLAEIFSRGGFTDRYFTQTDRRSPNWTGRGMLGVRSEDDKQNTRALPKWTDGSAVSHRKLPVRMEATFRRDEASVLTISCEDIRVTVTGDIPQIARKESAAMTEESAAKSLGKLGNTPFEATQIRVTVDSGLMLPAAALNALRRTAADQLLCERNEMLACQSRARTIERMPYIPAVPIGREGASRTAQFLSPDQITPAARDYFDLIYLPLSAFDGSVQGVALPPVIFDHEMDAVRSALRRAVELGAKHLLIGNIGHLPLARETGLILHGDFRLNVTNRETAALWQSLGLQDVLLSPELTLPQVRDVGSFGRTIVCGRIPLMLLEKCVIREVGGCETCRRGQAVLTDRKGVSFPVLREGDHRNIIYNSVPTYMGDREDELSRADVRHRHFIFSVERGAAVDRVIDGFCRGLLAERVFADGVRRIK